MSDQAVPAAGGGEAAAGIARNAFYLVLGQVATTALAIVFSATLGRSLGAQDFGVYYLITTMCAFAYVFVEWGQPYFVIREVAREPHQAGELLGTSLSLRIVCTLAVTVPVGLIAWAVGYGSRTTWLAILLILASLPLFLNQGYGMIFRARDRMGRDATVSVANKAIALALTLPALSLGLGIPGVILAQALAGLCALAVAHALFRRLGDRPRLHASRATARQVFLTGVPILAMSTATSAQPYLDAIVLSQMAPAHVMGWFGAAKNILGTLMAPAVILGAAAYPRIARASHDPAGLRREVKAAFRPLLWLGALAGTGTYLFAPAVIGLIYGAQAFGPAALVLQVFAPGLFLLFIDILLGNVIYASGRGTQFAIAKVASVVVGTGLDIVLVPVFQARMGNGGIGVVIAFALSEFVVLAGALRAMPRGTLDSGTLGDVARAIGAAAAPIALFRFLPPLSFWLGVPLCVATFAVAAQVLGLMGLNDLGVLRTLLRRRGADDS